MAQRSSNPTVAEKVGRGAIAEPRVRAYGYTEYDERRPGYVSSNPRAGAEWGALANALDGFYKGSTRAYTKYKENQIETGIANSSIATDFARETYGEQANKMAFKELVEKHPELANDNPWVEVGYEQARLRELGMEAKRGLGKYLDETGAFNSEDPAAFQQSVNTFFKEFREQAGVNSYEDKILVAKWFSPVEAETKKLASNQYETIRKNGRQDKLANQTSSNVATIIRASLDANAPINFDAIGMELTEASKNGLLNTKVPEAALNGLKIIYGQTDDHTDARQILELSKEIKIGGIRLIDTPAGAKWYDTEMDSLNTAEAKAEKDYTKTRKDFYENSVKNIAITLARATIDSGDLEGQRKNVEKELGRELTDTEWEDITIETTKRIKNLRSVRDQQNKSIATKSRAYTEVQDIIATSDNPRKALMDLWEETDNDIYGDAVKRLDKEGVQAAKAEAKEFRKYVSDISKAAIESMIKHDQLGIDYTVVSKTKVLAAISDTRYLAGRYLTAIFNQELDKARGEKGEITPQKREEAWLTAQQRFEKDYITPGVLTQKYTPESFNFSPDDQLPQTNPLIQTRKEVTPEEAPALDTWANDYGAKILESNLPAAIKNPRSFFQIFDMTSMFRDGVQDVSLQNVIKYLDPKTGIENASVSPDGKTIIIPIRVAPFSDEAYNIKNRALNFFGTDIEVKFVPINQKEAVTK